MKFITSYAEINERSSESLLDHIKVIPEKRKSKILAYLKSGTPRGVRCASVYDYVENESTFDTIHVFTDGEYRWDSQEIYHFEKYNIALNEQFVEKVLS